MEMKNKTNNAKELYTNTHINTTINTMQCAFKHKLQIVIGKLIAIELNMHNFNRLLVMQK